jgi:hypothetical protein
MTCRAVERLVARARRLCMRDGRLVTLAGGSARVTGGWSRWRGCPPCSRAALHARGLPSTLAERPSTLAGGSSCSRGRRRASPAALHARGRLVALAGPPGAPPRLPSTLAGRPARFHGGRETRPAALHVRRAARHAAPAAPPSCRAARHARKAARLAREPLVTLTRRSGCSGAARHAREPLVTPARRPARWPAARHAAVTAAGPGGRPGRPRGAGRRRARRASGGGPRRWPTRSHGDEDPGRYASVATREPITRPSRSQQHSRRTGCSKEPCRSPPEHRSRRTARNRPGARTRHCTASLGSTPRAPPTAAARAVHNPGRHRTRIRRTLHPLPIRRPRPFLSRFREIHQDRWSPRAHQHPRPSSRSPHAWRSSMLRWRRRPRPGMRGGGY